MIRNLILLILLLLPILSAAGKAKVRSGVKKGVTKALDTGEAIPIVGDAIKVARKFIPGASPQEDMVDLMEEQVETSKTALEQMQALARDMLTLKNNIEEADRIRRQAKQLFEDLSNAKYAKVGMGISEKISGISLNPSDYIPSLDSTNQLKRDCSFSYYREKSLLGSIDAFSDKSTNFLGKQPIKGLNQICSDIQKELLRSEKIKTAAKEANNRLIPIYIEQIEALRAQNEQIDKVLSDPRLPKDDPVGFFTLQSIKTQNIISMGKLFERINELRINSESLSKEDKAAIEALFNGKLYRELSSFIIKQKQNRNSNF